MKRFLVLLVALVVVVGLVTFPAFAQQAGLSIEQLAGRIDVLFAGQTYLTQRIIALETAVAISQQQAITLPTFTPTPVPPSPTPSHTSMPTSTSIPTKTATTKPTATARPTFTLTPTSASARVTADRRLSLRRAPGNSSIIAYIDVNNQFEVIGKNLDGSWVQVNYNGKIGWVSAIFADGITDVPTVPTPTPLPKPTVRPTITPAPTPTLAKMSNVDWELILTSIKQDMEGAGQNPERETFEQLREWTNERLSVVNTVSRRCELSVEELFEMMEPHAIILEESGIPAEEQWWVRWTFLSILENRNEDATGSCNWFLEGYVEWALDQRDQE